MSDIMARLKRKEEVVTPPKERIVAYVSKEVKERWQKLMIDMEVKNYEMAMTYLMDLYELCRRITKKRNIKNILRKLKQLYGMEISMQIIDKE